MLRGVHRHVHRRVYRHVLNVLRRVYRHVLRGVYRHVLRRAHTHVLRRVYRHVHGIEVPCPFPVFCSLAAFSSVTKGFFFNQQADDLLRCISEHSDDVRRRSLPVRKCLGRCLRHWGTFLHNRPDRQKHLGLPPSACSDEQRKKKVRACTELPERVVAQVFAFVFDIPIPVERCPSAYPFFSRGGRRTVPTAKAEGVRQPGLAATDVCRHVCRCVCGHVCRLVYRHVYGRVYRHVYRHVAVRVLYVRPSRTRVPSAGAEMPVCRRRRPRCPCAVGGGRDARVPSAGAETLAKPASRSAAQGIVGEGSIIASRSVWPNKLWPI